jgi:hypothetical protein
MTRIVPSQIVETIDRLFTGPSKGAGTAALSVGTAVDLWGIVLLLRQLPNELLQINASDFADLTLATAAIELFISRWGHTDRLGAITQVSGGDVVHVIRRVLAKCPDEAPPPGSADLIFIVDQKAREAMKQDIGAANSALQNAEWKAATILGGAAIEAMLHWKLSEPQTPVADLITARTRAIASRGLQSSLPTDPDQWVLKDFIAVARELGVIEEETMKQADTARNYRNLIHPGYAARRRQVCDRATALAVLSSLEHVIRDLSR